MPLFLSTSTMKVDRKGRVSVPAAFRGTLSPDAFQGIVVYQSFKRPCIHGADMAFMEKLSDSIHGDFGLYSDSHEALANATLASAHPLAFDPEGRVGLPKDLMEHAGITSHATFVGLGKTFQIWQPGLYEKHRKDQRKLAEEAARELSPMRPAETGGA